MRSPRIIWSEQNSVSASINAQDQGMGVRLESLLQAGSGIAKLLRRRHQPGCSGDPATR